MTRTRTSTAEGLRVLEAKIEAARSGDVEEGMSLLRLVVRFLERDLPLPEPLRRYLIDAFRTITGDDFPGPIKLSPHPTPKSLSELKENITFLEETRDANAALNLKRPRGHKRSKVGVLMESWYLDVEVEDEMRKGTKSLEEAIGAVADRMGISDRTVARARKIMKQVHSPRDDDSK